MSGHCHDAVLINLEGHLDLWDTTSCWWDSSQVELAKQVVVFDESALTLEHSNSHLRLLILISCEDLRLLCRDKRATFDDVCRNTAHSLDAEGQRSDIHENDLVQIFVLLATKDSTLNSSTISYGFIWVYASVRLLAIEELFDELLDFGDACGATNKDNLVNFTSLEARVFHDSLDRLDCFLEEIIAEFFKLGTGQCLIKINAVNQTLNGDLHLLDRRQVSLGFLNFRFELLQGMVVCFYVNAILFLEDFDKVISDALV
jgi:hypothetical protein